MNLRHSGNKTLMDARPIAFVTFRICQLHDGLTRLVFLGKGWSTIVRVFDSHLEVSGFEPRSLPVDILEQDAPNPYLLINDGVSGFG